jgi:hypothetical protein
MHGIKVLMAKNYINNLSEEARKNLFEWYATGLYSLKDVSSRVRQESVAYRGSGARSDDEKASAQR